VSNATGREVEQLGGTPEDIDIVTNGVNLDEFSPSRSDTHGRLRTDYDLPDERLAVSVGSIVPRKGVHTLVDVAETMQDRNLPGHIVHVGGIGHDGYANAVSAAIDRRGLDNRITLTGRVDREELLNWLESANVVISASFSEGCPISLLEAAASGSTIVATDVGGARDVLGDLGIYVKPGEPNEIADAIQNGFNVRYGSAIRERIETSFTWGQIADQMDDVYQRCVQ
jgi:glycosyltransferase involved in cell wall biosynthesis